jgi:hypothetical protein
VARRGFEQIAPWQGNREASRAAKRGEVGFAAQGEEPRHRKGVLDKRDRGEGDSEPSRVDAMTHLPEGGGELANTGRPLMVL